MPHAFTERILGVLEKHFGADAKTVLELSPLLKYIEYKTRSANRGSKARSSFGCLYAIYALAEDYLKNGFDKAGGCANYGGANFTQLMQTVIRLPFGDKCQNHYFNNRVNGEFRNRLPDDERLPIIANGVGRYSINEGLLIIEVSGRRLNIARAVLEVVNVYVEVKAEAFARFIKDCQSLARAAKADSPAVAKFIRDLITPDRDARLFEIVSYAVLKIHYAEEVIFLGLTRESVAAQALRLYKTGRTNANDGGIDFVMKPLGRFFQVTETLDVKKYFLDIDKIERYPISFVVKTDLAIPAIMARLEAGAREQYGVEAVVERYMGAIEEVINVPRLLGVFDELAANGRAGEILAEIIRWSVVEFNYLSQTNGQAGTVADEDEDGDEG